MTTQEDILKAMAAEKQKMLASSVKPQLRPNLTNADIIQIFLPVEIQIIGDLDQPGLIQIHGG